MLSRAEDGDARKFLRSLSDYMAAQNILSAAYDADIEVINPDLQKIQFTATGNVTLAIIMASLSQERRRAHQAPARLYHQIHQAALLKGVTDNSEWRMT